MSQTTVVAAALGSALCAATSSVLQHRSARTSPEHRRSGAPLVGHLLSHPLWLAGLVAAAGGLVLHAVALVDGRLSLVQPLLVSGVLFALPVSGLLEHRRISAVDWLWALGVVAGLAGFLFIARPTKGDVPLDTDVLFITCVACVVVMAVALVLARTLLASHPAPLLATAAGIGYGVTAALLKQASVAFEVSPVSALTNWPLYGFLLIGGVSLWVTQLAYRDGPLSTSMPVLTITDPLASILIGALAFHEQLASSWFAIGGETLAFVVMAVAVAELARRNAPGTAQTSPSV